MRPANVFAVHAVLAHHAFLDEPKVTAMIADGQTFIIQRTRPQPLPFVPEIRLNLADEVTTLWQELQDSAGAEDRPLPFWAVAWVGGQAVARYLLDHPEAATGKRVVDVATGSGVCAIAAAKVGAATVVAADIDGLAGDAVALNAKVNGVEVQFLHRDILDGDPPPADLILAGDVCYEEPLASRALSWLREAHKRGTRVLIGDPGRGYFRAEGFVELARYQIPTLRDVEGIEVKPTWVFAYRACREV